MATYQTILKISELWLKWDKKILIDFLEDLAVKEINNWKHSLYNWIKKLLNKYSTLNNDNSSFNIDKEVVREENFIDNYLPSKIWISDSIEKKLSNFINFYKNDNKLWIIGMNHMNKILLYWPPGTGKTTLGFYIAKKLWKKLRYVRISDIISSKFWETIKNFSNLFDSSSEEVIFIDEFDAFAKSRNDNNDVGELKRIVNAIIQILDFQAKDKIVIVSTNLVETIDLAISRRFAFKLPIWELNNTEAVSFLSFLIKNVEWFNIKLDSDEIKFIIQILEPITIDWVRIFFDKLLFNLVVSGKEKAGFTEFLELLISEWFVDRKKIKMIKNNEPKKFELFKSFIESKYSKVEISNILWIHRNSYNSYF